MFGQILKVVVDYLTKLIVVAVPLYGLLLAKVSWLSFLGDEKARAGTSIVLFTILFGFQTYDALSSTLGADRFIRDYLKNDDLGLGAAQWHTDLRLNVMSLRRAWWTLFLLRAFEIRGRKGFDAPGIVHPDQRLTLMSFQGLAGLARKLGQPQYASRTAAGPGARRLAAGPTWRIWDALWLLPHQVTKTAALKAILSVPMVRESKSGTWTVVGVINLDAISDAGADYIDRERAKLILALAKIGKHLAVLP